MLYLHPVNLLHEQQPHIGLLIAPTINFVPSRRDLSYSVRLQELNSQQFIARGCDGKWLEDNVDVSDV